MILIKNHIKIIKYIAKHPYCDFSKIKSHFKKMPSFEKHFETLRINNYIQPENGNQDKYGDWVPNNSSPYIVTDLGTSVCEANKLFTPDFWVKDIILPIIIAIITTLITIFLSALL